MLVFTAHLTQIASGFVKVLTVIGFDSNRRTWPYSIYSNPWLHCEYKLTQGEIPPSATAPRHVTLCPEDVVLLLIHQEHASKSCKLEIRVFVNIGTLLLSAHFAALAALQGEQILSAGALQKSSRDGLF